MVYSRPVSYGHKQTRPSYCTHTDVESLLHLVVNETSHGRDLSANIPYTGGSVYNQSSKYASSQSIIYAHMIQPWQHIHRCTAAVKTVPGNSSSRNYCSSWSYHCVYWLLCRKYAMQLYCYPTTVLVAWCSGSVVRRMNEVTLLSAQLLLGWTTIFRRVHHLGM